MIHVLIADDHAIIRDGLQALLQLQPDMRVVAMAANGREAIQQALRHCPDVAILDIGMPQLNGIDAARQILQQCDNTKIIILTMHTTVEHVLRALRAGVHGYLMKESAGAELLQAIRAVHAGQRYLCEHVSELVKKHEADAPGAADFVSPLDSLSHREREVLQLVVEGHTSAEIADRLFLAPSTVETYRSRLMGKLGIDDLPGLVKFALRHGLITLE